MDIGGGESVHALRLVLNRLVIGFGIFVHLVCLSVNGGSNDEDDGGQSDEDKQAEEDHDLCQEQCGDYGCCENHQCCDPQATMPSYAVQAMAVVGACVVTLLLLCLCIVRYRMAAKITRNTRRARSSSGNAEAGRSGTVCPSVSSGVTADLPMRQGRLCPWDTLRSLVMMETSRRSCPTSQTTSFSSPGGQVVTPPPYSELDPHGFVFGDPAQLPPPYEEVVKAPDSGSAPAASTPSSSSSAEGRRG